MSPRRRRRKKGREEPPAPPLTVAEKRAKRLRAFPHWEDIELALRHRMLPDRVAAWHQQAWPHDPMPSERTLWRYLRDQDDGFYVSAVVQTAVSARMLPRLDVLRLQAGAIEALGRRISTALAEEAKTPGLLAEEVRENLALYFRALESHFKVQQELGLAPVATRRVAIDTNSRGTVHHVYSFLKPDEAERLRTLEAKAERGELDVEQFYAQAAGLFRAEQQAAGRALPAGDAQP